MPYPEKIIFEIPIYRSAKEPYFAEQEAEKQNSIDYFVEVASGLSEEAIQEARERAKRHYDQYEWETWFYNQNIGWVQVFVSNQKIWGEYFLIDAKRISKTVRRKKFVWQGKAFEVGAFEGDTNQQIFEHVRAGLNEFMNRGSTKRRHLDVTAFQNAGPQLNWRKLVSLE